MTTQVPSEEKYPDSITDLWNAKNQLGAQIDALLKPFCKKYQVHADQVTICFNHAGVFIKVTF